MKHNAQIQIVQRINKKGEPYQMLQVYMQAGDKFIMIHEIYMRDSLTEIIQALSQLNVSDKESWKNDVVHLWSTRNDFTLSDLM